MGTAKHMSEINLESNDANDQGHTSRRDGRAEAQRAC
jgi:hypothetical protein